ncbi:MAG: metallophosphoesterase family protein [Oscillospiraceae bacterium]|nr:metallophosphoesterase family protein [Oscillospiraceae bacterium]
MKILVLSDSHSGISFMRRCVRCVKPDALIHLGDYFEDGAAIAEENPHLPMHQVPGNCDRYRMVAYQPPVLCYPVFGAKLYMTHGHLHNVKFDIGRLLSDARAEGVQAVLYGHTHIADSHQEEDGLWVLNPGSCGSSGGSVGVLEVENGNIIACRLIKQADLEEML